MSINKLQSLSQPTILLIIFIQIVVLGTIDFLTGYEISFSFFYLIPVALISWCGNKKLALMTALISAIVWQLVNAGAGEHFSHPLIPIWNASTRLGFFIVVSMLLIQLKDLLAHESNLARTDALTGAANTRLFYEIARSEIERSRRYKRVFSLCYFDADNFKKVNDKLGHQEGDNLIKSVVKIIKANLRSTDVVARLGGDEFAILLPETNLEQTVLVIDKIREKLKFEMDANNWNVTFSMGVLTCQKIPDTLDEIIKIADGLMYEVKIAGKDSVKYKVLGETLPVEEENSGLTIV